MSEDLRALAEQILTDEAGRLNVTHDTEARGVSTPALHQKWNRLTASISHAAPRVARAYCNLLSEKEAAEREVEGLRGRRQALEMVATLTRKHLADCTWSDLAGLTLEEYGDLKDALRTLEEREEKGPG